MPIKLEENISNKVLEVHVSGKLTKEDYQHFTPATERLIQQHGKIRILFEMTNFHGWEAEAIWEDIKFDLKHFSDIERVAMIGDKKWEKAMSTFCRPFTTAKIRYFDCAKINDARGWLTE